MQSTRSDKKDDNYIEYSKNKMGSTYRLLSTKRSPTDTRVIEQIKLSHLELLALDKGVQFTNTLAKLRKIDPNAQPKAKVSFLLPNKNLKPVNQRKRSNNNGANINLAHANLTHSNIIPSVITTIDQSPTVPPTMDNKPLSPTNNPNTELAQSNIDQSAITIIIDQSHTLPPKVENKPSSATQTDEDYQIKKIEQKILDSKQSMARLLSLEIVNITPRMSSKGMSTRFFNAEKTPEETQSNSMSSCCNIM